MDPLKTLFSSYPHSPQFKMAIIKVFFLRLLFGSGAISQKQPQKTLRVSGNTGNNSDSRAMPIRAIFVCGGGCHSHKTTQILFLTLPHYSQTISILFATSLAIFRHYCTTVRDYDAIIKADITPLLRHCCPTITPLLRH